jgi:hypothetical protein
VREVAWAVSDRVGCNAVAKYCMPLLPRHFCPEVPKSTAAVLPSPSFPPIAPHHMKALMRTKGHVFSPCEPRYVWTAKID